MEIITKMTLEIHKPIEKQLLPKIAHEKEYYDTEFTFNSLEDSIFLEAQDETKTIDENALLFFSDVYGFDEIKKNLYRDLLKRSINVAVILVGAPSIAKTELLKIIMKKCRDVVFFDCSSGSTIAGLFKILNEKRNTKIVLLDEISEIPKKEVEKLRGLMDSGTVSVSQQSKIYNFQIPKLKVFCTTNNPTKLSIPIKKRASMYLMNPYTVEEFKEVLKFCILKKGILKNEKLAIGLGKAMVYYNILNVRDALKIISKIDENKDTDQTIISLIKSNIKLDASECQINFNEVAA